MVGKREVEERARKNFRLAYSSWYLGNGPCHEAALLVEDAGVLHMELALTPEFDIGLPRYVTPWARPINPYELCERSSVRVSTNTGKFKKSKSHSVESRLTACRLFEFKRNIPN